MRLLVITKPMIFGFVLAIGISLTQAYLALGAGRSFGRSGSVKVSKIRPQQSFLRSFHGFDSSGRQDFRSHRFDGFGFVGGVGGVSEQPVIIIQQIPSAPTPEPKTCRKQNLRSAALGGRRVWSAGLTARILDRSEACTMMCAPGGSSASNESQRNHFGATRQTTNAVRKTPPRKDASPNGKRT
jgi:hypothetical protein